jgi:hypothetical protein
MATSALISLANAAVDFWVAGQGVMTDPDTGNVSPAQELVKYKAFLKAVNVDRTVLPGVDITDVVYEGYVVDPQELDPRVGVGSTGVLKFGSAEPVGFEVVKARMGYGDAGVLGGQLTTALGTKVMLLARE